MVEICSRCICGSDFPNIKFKNGICNYCRDFDRLNRLYPSGNPGKIQLNDIIKKIKMQGINRKYNCVIGVSGGTDSIYSLYLAKKWGLNPLAIHINNGFNSKISEENIINSTKRLGVDLENIILDWEDFKDIQLAFFKASVPSVDIPSDIAITSTLYRIAFREKIKNILIGNSFRTEGPIPFEWTYMIDKKFIKFIHRKFGKRKLNNLYLFTLQDRVYNKQIRRVNLLTPLYYVDYIKKETKNFLKKELGWKDYGEHHHENILTRFIGSYYLPKKFGIDKRITDYSVLIRSCQMTRKEALSKIKEDSYPKKLMEEDKKYITKKFGISESEMEAILLAKPKSNFDYPNNYWFINSLRNLKYIFKA